MASPPPLVPKLQSIFASTGFQASRRASSQMTNQVTSTSTFFNLSVPKHPTIHQYLISTRKKTKQINHDLLHVPAINMQSAFEMSKTSQHYISAQSDSDESRNSRASNRSKQINEEEHMQSKQQRYDDFLRQLPPLLSGIEDKYDFDRLTPLLKTHLRNLDSLEPPPASLTQRDLRNRENNQRQIFQLAKYQYNRDNERNSYVDSILTNYGLAQHSSHRDSQKYQTIISQHNNKMAQFKQDRKAIVASTEREKPLSVVQELMLEKKKARVMRFVERGGFVQVDFTKLRRERSEIDKIIKEAEDQNFRFLEPEAYNKQVFKRNMQTEVTNQEVRNQQRISIIEKSFESFQHRRFSQQVKSDQLLFNDMRRTAIAIFKTAHTKDIQPKKEPIPVQEIQAKLDLVFNDSNLKQLNSNNKKYIHLRVVQKLKQKRLPEKDTKKLKVEEAQQQASENLLSMADPYIKQQFKLFQKTLNKQKGPDFLQRMRSDQEERDDINYVKSAQKTSNMISGLLEISPRLRRGATRLQSDEVLSIFQPQQTLAAKRESEPELQKLSALIQPPQQVDNTRVNEIKQILGLKLSKVIKHTIEQTSGGQSPFQRPRGRGLTNQFQIQLSEDETPVLGLTAENSF